MSNALRNDMMVGQMMDSHDTDALISPLPRVSIQVFTETPEVAQIVQNAAMDRRMSKAHVKIQMGGAPAAVEAYRNAPTPNVIVIESRLNGSVLSQHLDELAGQCDEGTKVVIIGHVNDVQLYRDLMRRGVSEYLIAPMNMMGFIQTLSELYAADQTAIGRTIAVVGTKGGVGSSTLAHNIGFTISTELDLETVIIDFDLPFGTAGLDFNQDPAVGVVDAALDPERIDNNMIDRLLTQCGDKLRIMGAPATLERTYDFGFANFEPITDILRSTTPVIIYDLPHMWSDWTRKLLIAADDVIIVSVPDLANLRNAKNMYDQLVMLRKNDRLPKLVLNQVGMQKRPEIAIGEFSKAVGAPPLAAIPFDAQLFGTAANNGQMLADVQAKGKIAEFMSEIAQSVTGKANALKPKKSSASVLEPLLTRFKRK